MKAAIAPIGLATLLALSPPVRAGGITVVGAGKPVVREMA